MTERTPSGLRVLDAPFVADGPSGVAIKTRLHVTDAEAGVLRQVGASSGRWRGVTWRPGAGTGCGTARTRGRPGSAL